MKPRRQSVWLLLACLPLAACAEHNATSNGQLESATSAPQRGRLMPPPGLHCDRNDLTSYAGRVIRYSRSERQTTVTIETDAETVETVSVPTTSSAFLLIGNAFSVTDWHKIESSPGKLNPGMRVIAWICLDGETPAVLDWRPDHKL